MPNSILLIYQAQTFLFLKMQTKTSQNQEQQQPDQAKKSLSYTTISEGDRKQNMGSENIVNHKQNDDKPKSFNIFNQPNQQKKGINIFTQKSEAGEKKNIFTGQQKSVNLFNISTVPQIGNSNIFKSGAKPLVKTLDDDDNEKQSSNASSSQVNKFQSQFKTRPTELVMKFNYENPWTVVKSFNLKKFKNGNNASKEFIYLTFQKHADNSERIHLFVRTRETKVLVFQGFLMKGISEKISNFMNKKENLKLTVIKQREKSKEDETTVPVLAREELKIQFECVEDARDFKEMIGKELSQESEKARQDEI